MRCSSIILALALAGVPLFGANLLTNGSFELPASGNSPSLPSGSTYLNGWTVNVAEVAQIRNGDFGGISASNGLYSLDLTGYHDTSPYGGVVQTLATDAGAIYTLTFDVGALNGTAAVGVTAGDLSGSGSSTSTEGLLWTPITLTFTALGPSTNISLFGTSASGGGTFIGLDNVGVELTQAAPTGVPEPMSALLMSAGCGALWLMRRRPASRR